MYSRSLALQTSSVGLSTIFWTSLFRSPTSPRNKFHLSSVRKNVLLLIPLNLLSLPLCLTHWVPDQPIIIETDASNYALAAILSIQLDSSEIHAVAFHSCSFNNTKLNYEVHNKELFTIFEAF